MKIEDDDDHVGSPRAMDEAIALAESALAEARAALAEEADLHQKLVEKGPSEEDKASKVASAMEALRENVRAAEVRGSASK